MQVLSPTYSHIVFKLGNISSAFILYKFKKYLSTIISSYYLTLTHYYSIINLTETFMKSETQIKKEITKLRKIYYSRVDLATKEKCYDRYVTLMWILGKMDGGSPVQLLAIPKFVYEKTKIPRTGK